MTPARNSAPTRRLVEGGRYGPLVVSVGADTLQLRQKGRRTTYAVTWAAVYQFAGALAARNRVARRGKRRSLFQGWR